MTVFRVFLNVCVVIMAYHNYYEGPVEFETCWLETTSKGSDGSSLAFLPGVGLHLLFYIPMALLLILCTSYMYFMLFDVCSLTVMNIVSSTLNKLKWIEKAQKVLVVKLRAMYALSMRME